MTNYSQRDPSKNPFAGSVDQLVEYHNKLTARDPKARGVFASRSQSTAQYERWLPSRNHEYFDTMARMYISVNGDTEFKKVRSSAIQGAKGGDPDGGIGSLVDVLVGYGKNDAGLGYFDFLLHTADHRYEEKMQVSEVLSDNYVAFFFGQQAPIFTYTGTVMNTYQDNWLVNLYRVFQYLGRGTQLASRGLALQLTYDSFTFFGAMTNLNWRLVAGQETYAAFSFNFLVKKGIITTFNSNGPYNVSRADGDLAKQLQASQKKLYEIANGTYIPQEVPQGDVGETAQVESPTDETASTGPAASDENPWADNPWEAPWVDQIAEEFRYDPDAFSQADLSPDVFAGEDFEASPDSWSFTLGQQTGYDSMDTAEMINNYIYGETPEEKEAAESF